MRSKLRDSLRIRTGAYNRRFNSVEDVLQRGLALDLPRTAEVEAVQVQQVEGVEDQLVLSASSSSACSSEKSVRPSLMTTTSPSMIA
jgi:hypothetical protein